MINGNLKLYFVRFEYIEECRPCFHKFGITGHFDVLKRFKGDQYAKWHVRVINSAWGPEQLVREAEQHLLKMFPKNFWLEEKVVGVTELVKMNEVQIDTAASFIRECEHKWYKMRHA